MLYVVCIQVNRYVAQALMSRRSRTTLDNMAALCEPVPTPVEPSLFGIESGREEDTVIISNKKYFINTLKVLYWYLIVGIFVSDSLNLSY